MFSGVLNIFISCEVVIALVFFVKFIAIQEEAEEAAFCGKVRSLRD